MANPKAAQTGPRGTRQWRRVLARVAALVVGVPLAAILLFRFVPPPATPLMVIRLVQGHGWHGTGCRARRIAVLARRRGDRVGGQPFCGIVGFDFGALREQIDAWSDGEPPPRRQHHHHADGEEPVPVAGPRPCARPSKPG